MNDKELLELAAKAAGFINLSYCPAWKCMAEYDAAGECYRWETYWNPLRHYGHVLYLVVLLGLNITHGITPAGAKVVTVSARRSLAGGSRRKQHKTHLQQSAVRLSVLLLKSERHCHETC